MPDQEQFADLIFPLHGISLLQGFGMQTPGTTPIGLNVRTFEVLTQRGRGGSRPGLARYIPAQLPNGPHKIQMLNVVVDPGGGGLGDIDDGDFPDPSDAGPRRLWGIYFTRSPRRLIRRGGHGYLTYKNRKQKQKKIALVQTAHAFAGSFSFGITSPLSAAFAMPVTAGNMIAVCFHIRRGDFVNVSDNLGDGYVTAITQTLPGQSGVLGEDHNALLILWAIASTSGMCTVTAQATGRNPAGNSVGSLVILEYSGTSGLPIDGVMGNASTTPQTTYTTMNVPVSGMSELVLAAFAYGNVNAAAGPAFSIVDKNTSISVEHFIGAASDTAATEADGGSGSMYSAVGASFSPAS